MLDRPETEHDVESHESIFAADRYVHQNVRNDVEGVAFVEVFDSSGPCPDADGWQLWRVEMIASGIYLTTPINLRTHASRWRTGRRTRREVPRVRN